MRPIHQHRDADLHGTTIESVEGERKKVSYSENPGFSSSFLDDVVGPALSCQPLIIRKGQNDTADWMLSSTVIRTLSIATVMYA